MNPLLRFSSVFITSDHYIPKLSQLNNHFTLNVYIQLANEHHQKVNIDDTVDYYSAVKGIENNLRGNSSSLFHAPDLCVPKMDEVHGNRTQSG